MNAIKEYLYILMKRKDGNTQCHMDMHSLMQIIYQLTKVRGEKYVIQYFPHEVKDLYPALEFLARERVDTTLWYAHYIVLLWLGVIALVPFNLDIIDSGVISLPTEDGRIAT
jgi:tubulin-specific chaperone D